MALSSTNHLLSPEEEAERAEIAELSDLILRMNELQRTVFLEAIELHVTNPEKSPEECLELAAERRGTTFNELCNKRPKHLSLGRSAKEERKV